MERQARRAFTLIELVVVLALIFILAALLFPVFAAARERARSTRCLSNLKQISLAVLLYAQDFDEMLPRDVTQVGNQTATDPCSSWNPTGRLDAKLRPYVRNTEVFACPSANTPPVVWDKNLSACAMDGWAYPDFLCFPGDPTHGKPLSYGWNVWVFQYSVGPLSSGCDLPGIALAAVVSPESKVMVADSRSIFVDPARLAFANYAGASVGLARNVDKYWPEATAGSGPEIVPQRDARHQMGQNAAFFDGHFKWLPYTTFTGPSARGAREKWFLYWQ